LLVGAAIALGAAEGHQSVGGRSDRVVPLDRIPEQVPGDEDVGVVPEDGLQAPLDRSDPLELQGVVRHGLPVGVGIDDLASCRLWDLESHGITPGKYG
jgi:hypothetical protein